MSSVAFENSRRFHFGEALFRTLLYVSAGVVIVTLSAILLILYLSGQHAFQHFGPAFLWLDQWDPVRDLYGAAAPIVGTLASSAIALLIAWPLGFGIAYFLTETCPRPLRTPLGVAVELLAAIPSIVYGMWGFFVLAPVMGESIEPWLASTFGWLPPLPSEDNPLWWWFQGAPVGVGLLTSGVVLAIMILPFIAATTRDVLLTTPQLLKDGGYAMGATRWEVVTGIVIPAVRGSLFGAVFLGLGRALGETMAVTFVIGNANRMPDSFFAPTASISSIVANTFPEADAGSMKLAALFALGFILFVVSFVVLALARLLLRQGRMAA
ncbi:MAG TPA: phosphate ABC transporter permease subunit PstC [Vitreimonas sp.]|jgi:phosphate transport system permease protein|nr:phosphate ABC transporter permease subunit PstC [Vitreimonas sp.]